MTDYSKMSDKGINHSVLAIFEPVIEYMMLSGDETHFYHCGTTGNQYHQIDIPDYCNNPADAWPIIAENKINIDFRESLKAGPMAKLSGNNELYAVDKKPLRAAMIAFLLMKESEKCSS